LRATFSRFTGEGFALHIQDFRHRQKDHRRGRGLYGAIAGYAFSLLAGFKAAHPVRDLHDQS
jgi:hypothetical protein